jgi:hypothetical protein
MHDIEPYFKWRDEYVAADDKRSPFYGKTYDEFSFSTKVYNYYIHPQWDQFGSSTLYIKIINVDYDKKFAFIELIGEWNDCLHNDVMFLKREVIDHLMNEGITKYIISCDHVLNFHGSDDAYYEEWHDDVKEYGGWICFVNVFDHVLTELNDQQIYYYVNYGPQFNNIDWRRKTPELAFVEVEIAIINSTKGIAN